MPALCAGRFNIAFSKHDSRRKWFEIQSKTEAVFYRPGGALFLLQSLLKVLHLDVCDIFSNRLEDIMFGYSFGEKY